MNVPIENGGQANETGVRRSASRGSPRGGFYRALCAAASLALIVACQTTPVTGRKAFNLTSVETDKQLGADAYGEFLKTAKLADGRPEFAMVKRVVDRLVAVADDPGDFEWEVHLIDDDKTVNAWCMPGGKMAVYTGILPVTKDEAGLAVVMGHEIGHAVARHGTQRLSSQGLVEQGLALIGQKYQSVAEYQQYLGVFANVAVFMPWGRSQELESDEIGLIYMARAGYDPSTAVDFWTRMAALSGAAPPEFLSTHPANERRIEEIRDLLPKALKEYRKATGKPGDAKGVSPDAIKR